MKRQKQFKHGFGGVGKKFDGRKNWEDMYDAEWGRYRSKFLYNNPYCYACGAKATVVDHLIPAKGSEDLFKKVDNHVPLCHVCHNTITGKFDRNFISGSSIEPKLKWMADRRLMNLVDVRVKVLPKYGD